MAPSRFTQNKQTVRDLQGETIKNHLKGRLGNLSYFGLPSDEMKDIMDWKALFSVFIAVERGIVPNTWERQYLLMFSAFMNDILSKVTLLRGDIDKVILEGRDDDGNALNYPFDVITLDYSGGLLYREKEGRGRQYRLEAIKELIQKQAGYKTNYLLFVSSNLDNCKDTEIKNTLLNLQTELLRYGTDAKETIQAYLNHEKDEVRLKLYVPYFVNQIAAGCNYNCETEPTIFYLGNQDTRMMNFRFWLTYDPRTTAPRFPRESLVQIINSPMTEIKEGVCCKTNLRLPKLQRPI